MAPEGQWRGLGHLGDQASYPEDCIIFGVPAVGGVGPQMVLGSILRCEKKSGEVGATFLCNPNPKHHKNAHNRADSVHKKSQCNPAKWDEVLSKTKPPKIWKTWNRLKMEQYKKFPKQYMPKIKQYKRIGKPYELYNVLNDNLTY